MKRILVATLVMVGLPALAQTSTTTTTTSPTAPAGGASNAQISRVLSSLTPEEQKQVMDVREKAMSANPDLQKEEMDLMQKGMMMQAGNATDADKASFRSDIKAHADKVRAAMIKIDPTVEPIIAKVEASMHH